ncbi:MAG: rhodanese-like domain-containing protein [Candidatus Promineifilaceae bacterium]
MLLRYFYDQKLAQASYFVGCQETNEAIVIDPARFVDQYLELAETEGMRIVGATETHIHADFVSGVREIADRTGATLYLSDNGDEFWKYAFAGEYLYEPLKEGSTFAVGNIKFEVLHTPGHTPEHISLLMTDTVAADLPMGVFTGDFIFAGDVGRPDLLEKAAGFADSAEKGARQMFHSLRRFKNFPDYLQIWPGHGAGSACGRDLGAIPSSTMGYEKLFNWAFGQDDEDSFVVELLTGQPEPPRYFAVMKRVNREGPSLLHGTKLPERLHFNRLENLLEKGVPFIDTRPAGVFAASHISGTINIPHDSSFIIWAGWLIDYERPYYLIVDPHTINDVIRDLGAIGLDNCGGYFETSAIKAWAAAGQKLQCYNIAFPQQVVAEVERGTVTVVDVRSRAEWDEGHIRGAKHIMLGYLAERFEEIPMDRPVVVQCRIGRRSAIGASLLQSKGFETVTNLMGGIRDWEMARLAITRD